MNDFEDPGMRAWAPFMCAVWITLATFAAFEAHRKDREHQPPPAPRITTIQVRVIKPIEDRHPAYLPR